jgi:hypothetical protein
MFSVHRILLPIDFSERCLEAARHTVPTLAKHFGSEVVVLHVLAPYRECGTVVASHIAGSPRFECEPLTHPNLLEVHSASLYQRWFRNCLNQF